MKKVFSFYLIGLLLMVATWMACRDNTFRDFVPPNILFFSQTKPKPVPKLVDSLKNKLKNEIRNKSYKFTVFVRDPANAGVLYLKYSLSGGVGRLLYKGQEITDGIVKEVPREQNAELEFKPVGTTKAVYKLSFTGVNQYGVSGDPYTLTLVVFENIPPIARFALRPGNDGRYSRVLDASISIDGDSKYDGKILTYEYSMLRNNKRLGLVRSYDITSQTTPVVFPGPGTYLISLIVYDNDAAASSPVTLTEVVQ